MIIITITYEQFHRSNLHILYASITSINIYKNWNNFHLKNRKNKFEFLRTEVISMEIVLDGDDLIMVDDAFEQVLAKVEVQNEFSN